MGKKDPRVDAYIAKSGAFSRPVMAHLRDLVHKHCHDVEETLKWSSPSFTYHGILCGFAAFKAHCAFGFWHPLMREREKSAEAMGTFGRITSLKDLPPDREIVKLLKQAMKLNAEGIKAPKPDRKPKGEAEMPDDLAKLLRLNKRASKHFAAFSPSARREYIEWITEAKRPETREQRVLTTIEWVSDGKKRNWKYENC